MKEIFLKYFLYRKIRERDEEITQELKRRESELRKEKMRKYRSIYKLLDKDGKKEFREWILKNKKDFSDSEIEYILK